MQSKNMILVLTAAVLSLASLTTLPTKGFAANATPTSDPVCDPNVLNLMRQKGWMEAQRENYTNQSLILKPDSVFAATCFDKQLGVAKSKLGVKEKTGTTDDTTRYKQSIDDTAGKIAGSFSGASGNKVLTTPDKNSSTPNETSYNTSSPESADFNCTAMADMWKTTQCGNMSGADMPTLQEVGSSGKDSRQYPQACSAGKDDKASGGSANNYSGVLEQQYTKANAGIDGVPALNTYDCQHVPYSQLGKEPYKDCPATCTTISLSGRGTDKNGSVLEVSCPNPGCHPEPNGSSGYKCQPDS